MTAKEKGLFKNIMEKLFVSTGNLLQAPDVVGNHVPAMILTIAGKKYYWHNQLVTQNFSLTGSWRRSSSPKSDYDADDDDDNDNDDDDDDYQPSEESVQSFNEQEWDSEASVSSASQPSSTGSIVLRF